MFYCLPATSMVLPNRNEEVDKPQNLYSTLITNIRFRHASDNPMYIKCLSFPWRWPFWRSKYVRKMCFRTTILSLYGKGDK